MMEQVLYKLFWVVIECSFVFLPEISVKTWQTRSVVTALLFHCCGLVTYGNLAMAVYIHVHVCMLRIIYDYLVATYVRMELYPHN